jgi:hypothetical protein
MTKNSQVRFRSGSRLPAHLGLTADAIGTVLCNYKITHPGIGSPERVDVRFDGNRVAWGVPTGEFVLVEHASQFTGVVNQSA